MPILILIVTVFFGITASIQSIGLIVRKPVLLVAVGLLLVLFWVVMPWLERAMTGAF